MRLSEQKSVIRLTRRTARNAAAKFLVTSIIYEAPPLARAKFEHFYPESKGDRDTVFKRIPICVQPAQNCQIDWGEPDD